MENQIVNVTRAEFADILRIMIGENEEAEARAVCKRLEVEFEEMAFKKNILQIVDVVKNRFDPPNA